MIRLLRSSGFEVVELLEVRAPEGASSHVEPWVSREWARRWPSVEAWKIRKVREPER
jgi:hypothetical protein